MLPLSLPMTKALFKENKLDKNNQQDILTACPLMCKLKIRGNNIFTNAIFKNNHYPLYSICIQ
ncbi:hypothetical protein ABID42_002796 [Arcicella rosea]